MLDRIELVMGAYGYFLHIASVLSLSESKVTAETQDRRDIGAQEEV